jgi:hypothetical protein
LVQVGQKLARRLTKKLKIENQKMDIAVSFYLDCGVLHLHIQIDSRLSVPQKEKNDEDGVS